MQRSTVRKETLSVGVGEINRDTSSRSGIGIAFFQAYSDLGPRTYSSRT